MDVTKTMEKTDNRYKKKMDKGKFTIIFSKDDIDNLSDEAK